MFYKFFTPTKLAEAATFIHHHNTLTPRLLTFLSAPSNYYRLMIVPLIPPGVIGKNAKLVVKMAVGLETKFGSADSDPSFAISDGDRFVGMLTLDKTNYPSTAPSWYRWAQREYHDSSYRYVTPKAIRVLLPRKIRDPVKPV